ncbi:MULTISPECIES: phosphate ABC transporter permease subunit PstC [Bacillus]|jgi:phosphate transport system permease protein|uniref:Phosphate transport system permease protein n=3 Tax=Bacillus subtilis TaxID=1423 RepID=A0A0D1KZV4_BACIU|nr:MULTISPECIES: phosphate ABC transporter permease subunit PstC [Bacillus]AOL30253.1 phosphate ABC transporter permease subunit PstC [Alkalicoccobacillus gibsonii]AXC53574.1 phosphate ABC transporter permease subunit PstC [Bacillus spizizenii]MDP4112894.1 phosphate ABC transporter permease subunit PstC [Bacillota bacterium]MUF99529.1 phosphate ABC transporter permease subunit PstC [Bacillus tequilensis]AEP91532.1 phosphate ABC transporter, permease protein PstC [Bacillus subtilis subsp. subti
MINNRENMSVSERLISSRQNRQLDEVRGRMIVTACALIMIAASVAITIFLGVKGLQSFLVNGVSPIEFLTSLNWNPTDSDPKYGVLPFIFGSFAVTILSALIAAPLGIAGAIFMTEIAPNWGKKVLQPVIELLVGIPSVVYGFIGLTVLVPFIAQFKSSGTGHSLLAGTIVLSVMILPTITSISADAMASLPKSLREGSYALGATRWQTIRKVLVPAAFPTLMTAVVLGMARAFGEALAVQMVIGNTRVLPESLFDTAGTLTTIITLNMGHTTYGSVENNTLWSMGLVLLVMSFLFILLIRYLSSRRKV